MLFLLLAALPIVSCGRAPAPLQASVTVDAAKAIGKVPRFILGQNTEAGDNYGTSATRTHTK